MRLDPDSPVPLYHQLAEAIRYRIATGTLPAGAILPPLRRAAEEWGVNLHTVRHAYKALGAEGLVRTRPPHGTVVLASGGNGGGGSGSGGGGGGKARQRASDLEQFLVRVVREAGERFNLGPDELRRRLAGVREDGGSEAPALAHVVECSETQAADLAHQVAAAWTVRAEGWSLERPGAPPAGALVATYFHYNDVRVRWPDRFPHAHFVATRPDPDLSRRLATMTTERSARRGNAARATRVLVCERDAAMAANISADLSAVLPASRYQLVPHVDEAPGAVLATSAAASAPVLFAPRIWGALSPEQRAHPSAIEIRYTIAPKDLAALGADFGWSPRARG